MAKAQTVPRAMRNDKRLIQAVKEMAAHRRGEITLYTRKVTPPDKVDVAAIRGDDAQRVVNGVTSMGSESIDFAAC